MKSVKYHQTGFTLIEVMVVVVILGILASIIIPKVMDRPDTARITKVKADIRALESILGLYRLDHFKYPSTDQGLQALVNPPSNPDNPSAPNTSYISKLPKDPWGNTYQYLHPGVHGDIDIFTLGADKQPGGEGADSDLGNWNL